MRESNGYSGNPGLLPTGAAALPPPHARYPNAQSESLPQIHPTKGTPRGVTGDLVDTKSVVLTKKEILT